MSFDKEFVEHRYPWDFEKYLNDKSNVYYFKFSPLVIGEQTCTVHTVHFINLVIDFI